MNKTATSRDHIEDFIGAWAPDAGSAVDVWGSAKLKKRIYKIYHDGGLIVPISVDVPERATPDLGTDASFSKLSDIMPGAEISGEGDSGLPTNPVMARYALKKASKYLHRGYEVIGYCDNIDQAEIIVAQKRANPSLGKVAEGAGYPQGPSHDVTPEQFAELCASDECPVKAGDEIEYEFSPEGVEVFIFNEVFKFTAEEFAKIKRLVPARWTNKPSGMGESWARNLIETLRLAGQTRRRVQHESKAELLVIQLLEKLRLQADWLYHSRLGKVRILPIQSSKPGFVWVRTEDGEEEQVDRKRLWRRRPAGDVNSQPDDGTLAFHFRRSVQSPNPEVREGVYDYLLAPSETRPSIFRTSSGADQIAAEFQSSIQAEFVRVRVSSLGGSGRDSLMITVGLDPRSSWPNGILENSRYFKMQLGHDGVLELFSGWGIPKFRKTRVRSADEAKSRIEAFIELASQAAVPA